MAKKAKDTTVADVKRMVQEAIGLTGTWEQNQVKWNKMRMRVKKTKSFPFVGCSNLRMPTIETKIRKLKAALMNAIFGIRPVVQVIPSPSGNWQTAKKIEKFLDHLILDVICLKESATIAIDQALEKGFYLMKPYWKVDIITRNETADINDVSPQEVLALMDPRVPVEAIAMELAKKFDADTNDRVRLDNQKALIDVATRLKEGEDQVDFILKDVICDYPDVALCAPERVYVPTDSGFEPQGCRWIIHEYDLPYEALLINSQEKGWDIEKIKDKENLSSSKEYKKIDDEKELREGVDQLEKDGKVTIWEYYGYFDINGDGDSQKCVITIAPKFEAVMRKIALPFYSGKYPFVKMFYELIDDRWFSHRGIPELIEDIVKEIDIQHMQKIDQQTIRNTPMYLHRAGMIDKNAVQFVFGQSIPVHGMQSLGDVIAPLNNNNPSVEFSYEREQMLLETKVEELIGQIDFSLQSMINKRQPRTLGEVQLQYQNQQQVFSLDADLFREQFCKIFNWIWDLWCQYGSDNYEFAYFGKEGWENIKLTREETQGKYKVSVRGNDQNTNSQLRVQKAQMILAAQNNPTAIQMGVITPVNVAAAYKKLYQELDIPDWQELVMPPEAVAQQMQQQQQQPPPDEIRIKSGDLTDAEIMQVLAKRGIQPDSQGRALQAKDELNKDSMEVRSDAIDNLKKISEMTEGYGEKEEAEYEAAGDSN